MTNRQKSALEVCGGLFVAASAAWYNPILGLFVLGVLLIVFANFGGSDASLR